MPPLPRGWQSSPAQAIATVSKAVKGLSSTHSGTVAASASRASAPGAAGPATGTGGQDPRSLDAEADKGTTQNGLLYRMARERTGNFEILPRSEFVLHAMGVTDVEQLPRIVFP
jgi:hypothetical protein